MPKFTKTLWQRRWDCCYFRARLELGYLMLPCMRQSFELDLIRNDIDVPLLCVVMYHPPRPNSNFIQDFSDFLV